MKKFLFIIIATFMTNLVFAQTENYKIAIDNFQSNYNAEKYNEIFNTFSPDMKRALPLDKTEAFLTGLKVKSDKCKTKNL